MATINLGGGTLDSALFGMFIPVGEPVTDATFATAYVIGAATGEGVDVAFPAGATAVMLSFSAPVRIGIGGATPTASLGFPKGPDDGAFVMSIAQAPIQIIEEDATATAYIQFGR
jgi:hypothetical protein